MVTNPGMKTGWFSFDLPGYRPHPVPATYSIFDYESLPPIQLPPGDSFDWLWSEPIKKGSMVESSGELDIGKLSQGTSRSNLAPPRSFGYFINSVDLHGRLRSVTDCYFDLAHRVVPTHGVGNGFLVHFMSHSQWYVHWYLHVSQTGDHCVAVSDLPYGFDLDPNDWDLPPSVTDPQAVIELAQEPLYYCSPSFDEFIYRYWLENEIWMALAWDKVPLNPVQQAYVDHYALNGRE